jgi:hypothetical protein
VVVPLVANPAPCFEVVRYCLSLPNAYGFCITYLLVPLTAGVIVPFNVKVVALFAVIFILRV